MVIGKIVIVFAVTISTMAAVVSLVMALMRPRNVVPRLSDEEINEAFDLTRNGFLPERSVAPSHSSTCSIRILPKI